MRKRKAFSPITLCSTSSPNGVCASFFGWSKSTCGQSDANIVVFSPRTSSTIFTRSLRSSSSSDWLGADVEQCETRIDQWLCVEMISKSRRCHVLHHTYPSLLGMLMVCPPSSQAAPLRAGRGQAGRSAPATRRATSAQAEQNPPRRNDFGIQSVGLHHQQAAAVGQQVGHGPAQRVKYQSPVVAGVPRPRQSRRGRQRRALSARIMRYIRRIAHDEVERRELDRAPRWTSTSTPAASALARAQCTARGQTSKALTEIASCRAALMATTPLPVHRSATQLPCASPAFAIAQELGIFLRASTPSAATTLPRSSVYAVVTSASRQLRGHCTAVLNARSRGW